MNTTELTIRKIGNSMGATFPKELLNKLRVSEGDNIYVTETPEGIFKVAKEVFLQKTKIGFYSFHD